MALARSRFLIPGGVALVATLVFGTVVPADAAAQAKTYTLPAKQGKLTSNTWRGASPQYSGNTAQWNYQVSAVYAGSSKVKRIRTSWTASASLRSGASFSIGISTGGISVGRSSNWQTVKQRAYWENRNGAKTSWWRSNYIVAPSKDYRSGSVAIVNTALVVVDTSTTAYTISSGA